MRKYRVVISAHYEFEAESEDQAEYLGIDALKKDLPDNEAPLEVEVSIVEVK